MTWRGRIVVGLGAVLALVGAFCAGRFSAPLQVQTVDKIVWKEREESKTNETEKKNKRRDRQVVRDVVRKPDGTVVERVVETSVARVDVEKMASGVTVKDGAGGQERSSTTTLRPSWRVSLQVGASYPKPALNLAGPLVLGAQVDYRIYGGLTAGVWGNTVGAGGVGASFEF